MRLWVSSHKPSGPCQTGSYGGGGAHRDTPCTLTAGAGRRGWLHPLHACAPLASTLGPRQSWPGGPFPKSPTVFGGERKGHTPLLWQLPDSGFRLTPQARAHLLPVGSPELRSGCTVGIVGTLEVRAHCTHHPTDTPFFLRDHRTLHGGRMAAHL